MPVVEPQQGSVVASAEELCMLNKLGMPNTTSFAVTSPQLNESLNKLFPSSPTDVHCETGNSRRGCEKSVKSPRRCSDRIRSQGKVMHCNKIAGKTVRDKDSMCKIVESDALEKDLTTNNFVSKGAPSLELKFMLNVVMESVKSLEVKFETRFCALEERLKQTELVLAELREAKICCRNSLGVKPPTLSSPVNVGFEDSGKVDLPSFSCKISHEEPSSHLSPVCEELPRSIYSEIFSAHSSQRTRSREAKIQKSLICSDVSGPRLSTQKLCAASGGFGWMFGELADSETVVWNAFLRWQATAKKNRLKNTSEELRLPSEILKYADREWFDDIKNGQKWLRTDHVEALLYLVSSVYEENGGFQSKLEWTFLEMFVADSLKSPDVESIRKYIASFISGTKPLKRTVAWTTKTRVYSVLNVCGNHWVLFEINMREQEIIVYDSLPMRWSIVSKEFLNMSITLPIICRDANLLEDLPYKSAWDIAPYRESPRHANNSDCGIMAIKYLECSQQYNLKHLSSILILSTLFMAPRLKCHWI
ncbi:uncharacterized protein LOC131009785 [Salvia miltiorrhiza]|uniref:uncharacterized protein LOC131009785 n=1 Tax=Salvia miltiorrhiza TaxID=226208 RepID=UPI0025AC7665|nr:uncharacterized protein LOC131009785 [Salvia miltiorrhiza]